MEPYAAGWPTGRTSGYSCMGWEGAHWRHTAEELVGNSSPELAHSIAATAILSSHFDYDAGHEAVQYEVSCLKSFSYHSHLTENHHVSQRSGRRRFLRAIPVLTDS